MTWPVAGTGVLPLLEEVRDDSCQGREKRRSNMPALYTSLRDDLIGEFSSRFVDKEPQQPLFNERGRPPRILLGHEEPSVRARDDPEVLFL
jgi:hypothetical protein